MENEKKNIKGFENLDAWKLAHQLGLEVYSLTNAPAFDKDFDLKRQIRRCAVSVGSNIAEGFERGGNKEFVQFLTIAKGSCGELRSQLIFAKDLRYLGEQDLARTIELSIRVGKVIGGLIRYIKASEMKGYKFQEPEVEYR